MTTTIHPDRHKTTTNLRKNGVVVHDSEGGEGTLPNGRTASSQLIAFIQAPGDREYDPPRPGQKYGSSYHIVVTETGDFVQLGGADINTFSAPPTNPTMWHVCIPGRAAQTREQWLDAASRWYITGVARAIVHCWELDGRSWPLEFEAAAELVQHGADRLGGHPCGYTAHAQVSLAFRQSDHTDPGLAFPWEVLAADIQAFITPPTPPEDDMTTQILYRDTRFNNVFWLPEVLTVGGKVLDKAKAGGAVEVVDNHDQSLINYMRGSKLTMAQMVATPKESWLPGTQPFDPPSDLL